MSDISYSEKLRYLSKDYYQHHISLEEYRTQRKTVLDMIDEEFNGRKMNDEQTGKTEDSSILMKTIAFFKNTNAAD